MFVSSASLPIEHVPSSASIPPPAVGPPREPTPPATTRPPAKKAAYAPSTAPFSRTTNSPAQTRGPATTTGCFDLSVPRTSSPLDEHVDAGSNVWADHVSTSPPPAPASAPAPEFDPLASRPAASKAAKTNSHPRGASISSAHVMARRQPSRKPSSTFQPREREIVGTTYTWSNPAVNSTKARRA
ncbi:hypothetical protein CY34DRAFT_19279 [Suillus luteus UH-Slu-Lm8-n1]|uniref:Uncharacterized protein n=1 Tax=Suillus luteus UH-Slu-Lm8-n1 TaxID=930992 RepID=A0A0D0AJJ6_9AGAM|nr:hypothetical protein CY34DRAFT_19279 [Suillus luteus UH-Slu-Lm8-n1]